MGSLITITLLSLLDTIISLLFNGAMWISGQIMNGTITTFNIGDNILTSFLNLLPFVSDSTINVSSIINGISNAVLMLCFFLSIASDLVAPVTGKESENLFNTFGRFLIAIIVKTVMFGFSLDYVNLSGGGILADIGNLFTVALSGITIPEFNNFAEKAITLNPAAYIGIIILMATLLAGVIGAAVSYIERILSFALTIIIGPVALSLYAHRKTEHIAEMWFLSIFTQFLAIALNLLLWAAFITQMNSFDSEVGIDFTVNNGEIIFRLAIAVSLLSLIKNCEKILNAIGLRTLPNLDAARSISSGTAGVASIAMISKNGVQAISKGAEKLMHKVRPAVGGKGGYGNASSGKTGGASNLPYSGNNSIYDKDGCLSVSNNGNSFSRALAMAGGNYGAFPFAGKHSVRSVQNSQANAISIMNSKAEAFRAHAVAPGDTFNHDMLGSGKDNAKAELRSGTEIANAAMNGYTGGAGFRFTGSELKYASLITQDGKESFGVFGDATFEIPGSGRVSDVGTYFMPITNGGAGNKISPGTVLNQGDSQYKMQTSGSTYRIDENDAVAYKLERIPEPREASYSEYKAPGHNEPQGNNDSEIISEQLFGEDNIADGDDFDPSI